jgi:D-xylose transport system ATP-binding protein
MMNCPIPADPLIRRPLLEMCRIGKSFPGVRALDGITFDLYEAEIHALVGENGAGKSTLIKILGGVYPYSDFEGEIRIDAAAQRFRNVRDSEQAGIAVVFQELSLVPEMTVGENVFLGREPRHFGVVQSDALYAQSKKLLEELQLETDPHIRVDRLGVGQQQLVEIAKALSHTTRILVLDEPTAALTDVEAANLFSVLAGLRDRGIGIIYISHRLEEVFRVSDRITVLRDGSSVGTKATREMDEKRVIAMMVGREITQLFPPTARTHGEVVLDVRHITAQDAAATRKLAVRDVSFAVRRGEVLGIAGLMGAGRTELLMSLFGSHPGGVTGQVFVAGKAVRITKPADAIANGIGFVTEDRKRYGLFSDQTVLHNMTLSALWRISGSFVTDESRELAASTPLFKNLQIKANSLFTVAGTLSGGNQQKVVLSKWLLTHPRVLFLDEPTRGIDIGAKQEIYREIDKLAQSGLAVVIVSSDLPEVLGLSDRVIVLHDGTVTGEFTRESATPEEVMACATGRTVHVAAPTPAGNNSDS